MKTSKFLPIILAIVLFISFLQFAGGCSKDDDSLPVNNTDSIVVAMNLANWDCFNVGSEKYILPTAGKFEFTAEGVKGYGESSRMGSFLITTRSYELKNRTVYMKWKGNDGGAFVGFVVAVVYNAFVSIGTVKSYYDLNFCSSPTSFDGSIVVSNNQWYYTTVKVTNNSYTTTTASGNYADNGGSVIENRNGTLINTHGKISLRNGDAYAGNASYIVINELKIK